MALSKQSDMYSLFEREGNSWRRISCFSYRRPHAVRIYQSALLAHSLAGAPERRIMPVGDKLEVPAVRLHNGEVRCICGTIIGRNLNNDLPPLEPCKEHSK